MRNFQKLEQLYRAHAVVLCTLATPPECSQPRSVSDWVPPLGFGPKSTDVATHRVSRRLPAPRPSTAATVPYSGGRLMTADPSALLDKHWLGVSPHTEGSSFGSPGNQGSSLRSPSSHAATPMAGYWLVATDGGVFSYGDAKFYGSTGAIHLNQPIVNMEATPDGLGYWLSPATAVSSPTVMPSSTDRPVPSTQQPIVGIRPHRRSGLLAVASDGGVFTYGDAKFYGSTGSIHLNKPSRAWPHADDKGTGWSPRTVASSRSVMHSSPERPASPAKVSPAW